MSTYAIRGGTEGARRLDLLALTMGPTTESLLASAGVRLGMRCLDLGCGAGHVSRVLAAQVGPAGQVVGLDFDPVKLESAKRHCAGAGLGNVEFRATNVAAWREAGVYDLVYGRFILSHLSDRAGMVAAACEALRSGGMLVLEDIDFSGAFCWPPDDGYATYCRLYAAVIGRKGGDANAGAELYAFCVDAGLADVRVQVVHPAHTGRAAEKGLSLSTLLNIADAVLAEGLATQAELDAAIASMTELTNDPRSVVATPRVFQVWGRKPPMS